MMALSLGSLTAYDAGLGAARARARDAGPGFGAVMRQADDADRKGSNDSRAQDEATYEPAGPLTRGSASTRARAAAGLAWATFDQAGAAADEAPTNDAPNDAGAAQDQPRPAEIPAGPATAIDPSTLMAAAALVQQILTGAAQPTAPPPIRGSVAEGQAAPPAGDAVASPPQPHAAATAASRPTPADTAPDAAQDASETTSASAVASSPQPGSAMDQVLSALRDLGLGSFPDAASQPELHRAAPARPAETAAPDATRAAPMRSITIQLNPEHLGPVAITLRLKEGGIDVQIAVSSTETLHLLDRDRHLLTAMVEAAGGTPRDLAVAITPATTSSSTDNQGAAGSGASPFSQGDASASSNSSGGQPRTANRPLPDQPPPSVADDRPHAPSGRARGLDGSLYL